MATCSPFSYVQILYSITLLDCQPCFAGSTFDNFGAITSSRVQHPGRRRRRPSQWAGADAGGWLHGVKCMPGSSFRGHTPQDKEVKGLGPWHGVLGQQVGTVRQGAHGAHGGGWLANCGGAHIDRPELKLCISKASAFMGLHACTRTKGQVLVACWAWLRRM